MTMFKLEEITQSKQRFEYQLKNDTHLTLVFVLAKSINVDVHVVIRLTGRGAMAEVIGLVAGGSDQKVVFHTEQIHEAPETTSNLLVKAVLFDQARFTYNGVIRVERNAQKTDAYQKNENLLLSHQAHARSDPALEILANDVRCTHGSTTGKLNEDQLWYLASRGLSRSVAEQRLVEGFFEHAISTISDTINQENIRRLLWQSMSVRTFPN